VTFDWATPAGTASAGVDYVTASGSLTIAAGATSATIAITVNGDVLDEVNETFTVALSNPANATIADGSGLGTITDDDAPPTVSVDDVSVTEGNAGTTTATFTVSLSAASAKTVTVGWSTADADAVQPVDYTAGSGTLTFDPGDTSEPIAVTVNGDLVAELDETFRVTLTAPSNATLADAIGIGTVVDDELLPVIDIRRAHGPPRVGFDRLLRLPVAPVAITVEIAVKDDEAFEHDETMAVDLSNASGARIGDTLGIGTIANDDDTPGLSVGDVSVVEGNTGQRILTFAVSLTGDTDVDATVGFATAGLTASAGTEYADAAGTLTVPAGDTGATIDVVVNADATYEANETLAVTLSTAVSAVLVDGTAVVTSATTTRHPPRSRCAWPALPGT
jgi:hypothetical protein